MGIAFRLQKP